MSDFSKNLRTAATVTSAAGGAAAAVPAAGAMFNAMIPFAMVVPGGPFIMALGVLALGAAAGPVAFNGAANVFGWPRR